MADQDGSQVRRLAELLTQLDRSFRDAFKRNHGVPAQLTLAQYQVLSLLAESGECSQSVIAEHLGVTGPTVVRIIDALERKGLVRRSRGLPDRRLVMVALTSDGQQAQVECAQMQMDHLAVVMERLPATTADALLGQLSALVKATQTSTG